MSKALIKSHQDLEIYKMAFDAAMKQNFRLPLYHALQ
jgi:hypothetical protein